MASNKKNVSLELYSKERAFVALEGPLLLFESIKICFLADMTVVRNVSSSYKVLKFSCSKQENKIPRKDKI